MNEYSLNICHLYPDVLNLYGDTGNIICLEKRLNDRGIGCNVTGLGMNDLFNAADYDLFFIGGGQDFEQDVLLKDVKKNKTADIISAIEDEKVMLAICGGYQILGSYYKTWDGRQLEYMGALDLYTVRKKDRLIGNYMFTCDQLQVEGRPYNIVGFENHSGMTYLGDKVKPMGKVLTGHGNNGQDGTEGAIYKNVFCSYSHGPMLPKNPAFADLLLGKALEKKYGKDVLAEMDPLDDDLENHAHRYMEQRLMKEVKKEVK